MSKKILIVFSITLLLFVSPITQKIQSLIFTPTASAQSENIFNPSHVFNHSFNNQTKKIQTISSPLIERLYYIIFNQKIEDDEGIETNHSGYSSTVIDDETGSFIKGNQSKKERSLASLTKLMTALVIMDLNTNLEKKITITNEDLNHVNDYINPGDSTSKIDLREGDEVRAKELLQAMLIASSNEAAVAIVRATNLNMDEFVDEMNKKAHELGLKDTTFTEPSGIDPENKGTARDMARIARKAFDYEEISENSIKEQARIKISNSNRKVYAYNRNASLLAMDPKGMKIGYLYEALNCVAILLKGDDKNGVIVVLKAESISKRNDIIKDLRKELN
jgi:D-alanyl-D-alanine carboxypeptidase